MKLTRLSLITGFLVLASCSDAAAFGRGGGHGGGAPPRGDGAPHGGGIPHGVGVGPIGGVHPMPHIAPHIGSEPRVGGFPHEGVVPRIEGDRGFAGRPFGGEITRPEGGFRPGGEGIRPEGGFRPGGEPGAVAGRPGATVITPGSERGGVAIGRGGVGGGFGGAGHSTFYMRDSTLHGIGNNIRRGGYSYFTRDWFRDHGGAWFPGFWAGGLGLWGVPVWDTLAPFMGIGGPPIDYDYGSGAVFQDNMMYLNGEPLAPATDYAAQAIALDDAGRAAMPGDSDEWEPLGVFGLIQGSETVAQRIFQLAVNKAGIVRGNYYDAVADNNLPVFGEVDPKTQRVAWSIGDKKDIVFEAGLNNLLQNETTVLIHFGKVRTVQMILVRLPTPPAPNVPSPPSTPNALPTPPPK